MVKTAAKKKLVRAKKLLGCNFCEKLFDRPSLLARHIRTHTGDRPYRCHHCGKTFSTSSSLNTHTRIHSGERPHQCNVCLKRWTFNFLFPCCGLSFWSTLKMRPNVGSRRPATFTTTSGFTQPGNPTLVRFVIKASPPRETWGATVTPIQESGLTPANIVTGASLR